MIISSAEQKAFIRSLFVYQTLEGEKEHTFSVEEAPLACAIYVKSTSDNMELTNEEVDFLKIMFAKIENVPVSFGKALGELAILLK